MSLNSVTDVAVIHTHQTHKQKLRLVNNHLFPSPWPTPDKLDGVRSAKKRMSSGQPRSIEDWLQLSQDYDTKVVQPGKKRVSVNVFWFLLGGR